MLLYHQAGTSDAGGMQKRSGTMQATHAPVVSATVSTKVPSTSLPTIADLDCALERSVTLATEHDLEVLRSRRRASDGVKVYTVSSFSDPTSTHEVELRRGQLRCDCAAAHFRPTQPCAHATCVWMALVVDLSRRERVTRRIGARLAEALPSSAFGPPSPEHPQLADDGRGFSLFK
jgi:hypothetical protein